MERTINNTVEIYEAFLEKISGRRKEDRGQISPTQMRIAADLTRLYFDMKDRRQS